MKNFRISFAPGIFITILLSVFCFSSGVSAETHTETEELDLSLGDILNLQVSVATKTENLNFNLTYFNVKAEDLVQLVNKVYINVGRMESKGVEGELRVNWDRFKYGYINFTWQKVRDTTNMTIKSEG
ncbi:MAG: TonB-dependent receptor [Desulfobacterales bacterium]|nr:TonB-dependent receptor [Desulfobacterales bacterium]